MPVRRNPTSSYSSLFPPNMEAQEPVANAAKVLKLVPIPQLLEDFSNYDECCYDPIRDHLCKQLDRPIRAAPRPRPRGHRVAGNGLTGATAHTGLFSKQ